LVPVPYIFGAALVTGPVLVTGATLVTGAALVKAPLLIRGVTKTAPQVWQMYLRVERLNILAKMFSFLMRLPHVGQTTLFIFEMLLISSITISLTSFVDFVNYVYGHEFYGHEFCSKFLSIGKRFRKNIELNNDDPNYRFCYFNLFVFNL
jgi:hypothetical protein